MNNIKQNQLIQEWEQNRKKISTERIQTNIKQLQDWYLEDNPSLIINPNFQRLYRWDKEKKTNLIESILMGIPIPPIFVSENIDGKYEVIDGLQRISTILEFLGILKTDVNKEKSIKGGLLEPSYLKSLEGMKFDDLPSNLQKRFLNTYRIDLNILTSESDISAKYELFNRLNSGGEPLKPQEIRNTLILQFNKDVYKLLKELSEDKNFIDVLNITEKKKEVEKDTEYVLRFQALLDYDGENKIKSVSKFLDNEMKNLLKNNKIDKEIFYKTFIILKNINGGNGLKRNYQVNIPGFDAIAGGISYNLKNNNIFLNCIEKKECIQKLSIRINALWRSNVFEEHTGSKTGKFVEHKLMVSLFIGRKIFNLKEDFGKTEEEIAKKIDELISSEFSKK